MLKKAILALAFSSAAFAAQCNFTFTLDNAHTVFTFNNQAAGCYFWNVNYFTAGFSAVTITFEFAPNGVNSSTPGAFSAFTPWPLSITGDLAQGSSGIASWVRVRLVSSTGTGTVTGQIIGASLGGTNVIVNGANGLPIRTNIFGNLLVSEAVVSALTDGATNSPDILGVGNGAVNVAAYSPTLPFAFNGATWDRQFVCPLSAPITFTASSGSLQIVGLTAAQIIRVCHVSLASDTATNITLQYGTGSNCAGGTTALTGAYNGVKTLALDFGPEAALRTASANAFCVSSSASATIGGVVSYAKF